MDLKISIALGLWIFVFFDCVNVLEDYDFEFRDQKNVFSGLIIVSGFVDCEFRRLNKKFHLEKFKFRLKKSKISS